VTPKALPALDRKLAAAASVSSTSLKSRKHEKFKGERPAKRRKTEPGPRVEMSAKAKKALLGGDGRVRNRRHSLPGTRQQDDEAEKPKRGRPRLTSPSRQTAKDEEVSLQFISEAKHQPRDTNGRFESKRDAMSSIVRKTFSPVLVNTALSRAQRAIERGKVKSWLERKAEESERKEQEESGGIRMSLRNRKRANDTDNEKDDHPRKKVQRDLHGPGVVRGLETPHPLQRILPGPASSFRGGKLFSNPNPLSFAMRAWATPVIQGGESSEDETAPVTPEDYNSPPTAVVESDQEVTATGSLISSSIFIPGAAPPRGALTFKPSPFTFARRRWASMSASTVDDDLAHRGEQLRRNSLSGSRVDDAAIGPEEISDIESLGGSDHLSSISSLSMSSANAGPSFTRWSKGHELSSLSGEEVRSAVFA
jgi:histone-lysine N-methyltransferase SUV420H